MSDKLSIDEGSCETCAEAGREYDPDRHDSQNCWAVIATRDTDNRMVVVNEVDADFAKTPCQTCGDTSPRASSADPC